MTSNRIQAYAVRLGALVLCSAALSATPALAQAGGGMRGNMMEQQQARLDSMVKAIGLTDDQVVKVKAIQSDSMKQMMELRSAGGDPQEMRPKMMTIRQGEQTRIKALLTEDQKPKYDAWLAAQPGRPSGGGGQQPPPSPPPQL